MIILIAGWLWLSHLLFQNINFPSDLPIFIHFNVYFVVLRTYLFKKKIKIITITRVTIRKFQSALLLCVAEYLIVLILTVKVD